MNSVQKAIDNVFLEKLKRHAEQFATKTAYQVIEDDHNVTQYNYQYLFSAVQDYAEQLISCGVKPYDRVVIISESHPAAMVALLGCWMAQAIPVPIDSSLGITSWQYFIDHVKASVISVSPVFYASLPAELNQAYPIINHHRGQRYRQSRSYVVVQEKLSNLPENLAIMLMTSGTSGRSKAVMLSFENMIAGIENWHTVVDAKHSKQLYCPLPYHHIFPLVFGYLLCLYYGMTLTSLLKVTPNNFRRGIALSQPHTLLAVAPLMSSIYRKIRQELAKKSKLANKIVDVLRYCTLQCQKHFHINLGPLFFSKIHRIFGYQLSHIITAGSHLDDEICAYLQSFGLPFVEGYGLSETCGGVICCVSDFAHWYWRDFQLGVSIAEPDSEGFGEICYQGSQLMLGYLNNEQATNDVIRDGVFYSGDIGRLNKRYQLIIQGRKDDLIVTTGGKKIVPDDVEHYFKELTTVVDFSVFGMPLDDGSRAVHAAVVLAIDEQTYEQAKKQFEEQCIAIAKKIPAYMQIQQFHFLSELPKANGFKVKRKLLPDLIKASQDSETVVQTDVKKISKTEKTLLSIWQDIFAEENLNNLNVSFFELGGDSLMLADLINQIGLTFAIFDPKAIFMEKFIHDNTIINQSRLIDEYLANHVQSAEQQQVRADNKARLKRNKKQFVHSQSRQRIVGGFFQLVILLALPMYWFASAYPTYKLGTMIIQRYGWTMAYYLAPLGYVLWFVVAMVIFIFLKKLIIGRYQPGDYPLFGTYYYRWWTIMITFSMLKCNFSPLFIFLSGTSFLTNFYRLLGMKIGRHSQISSENLGEWDLVEVGEGSEIASGAILATSEMSQGVLKLRKVTLGNHVKLGEQSLVKGGSSLADNTLVKPIGRYDKTNVIFEQSNDTTKKPLLYHFLQYLFGLMVLPYAMALAIFLGVITVQAFHLSEVLTIWLVIALALIYFFTLACATKWLLLGKMKPGEYRRYGCYAFRKWFVSKLLTFSDGYMALFAGSSYYTQWLRLCGMKIGKKAIIVAANMSVNADLLEINENAFCSNIYANTTVYCDRAGFDKQDKIVLGKNSFAYLYCYLYGGGKLNDGAGIAGLTSMESTDDIPAGYMKSEDKIISHAPDPLSYTRPPAKIKWYLAFFNYCRFFLIALIVLLHVCLSTYLSQHLFFLPWVISWALLYWCAKCYYLFVLYLFNTPISKGTFRLWDIDIQRRYAFCVQQTWLCQAFILPDLVATPFVNFFYRRLGAKIGKGVILAGVVIGDWPLLKLGDYAVVNQNTHVIGHMMMGNVYGRYLNQRVRVGAYSSVGRACVILPNTHIKKYVNIASGYQPISETVSFDRG